MSLPGDIISHATHCCFSSAALVRNDGCSRPGSAAGARGHQRSILRRRALRARHRDPQESGSVEDSKTDPTYNSYRFFQELHNGEEGEGASTCEHQNEIFVSWHRALLYLFERALQEGLRQRKIEDEEAHRGREEEPDHRYASADGIRSGLAARRERKAVR